MTGIFIVPVDEIDAAIGPPAHVYGAKVLVTGHEKVRCVRADKARTVGAQVIVLQGTAGDAAHEEAAAQVRRNGLPLQDNQPGMGPAAFLVMDVVAYFPELTVRI